MKQRVVAALAAFDVAGCIHLTLSSWMAVQASKTTTESLYLCPPPFDTQRFELGAHGPWVDGCTLEGAHLWDCTWCFNRLREWFRWEMSVSELLLINDMQNLLTSCFPRCTSTERDLPRVQVHDEIGESIDVWRVVDSSYVQPFICMTIGEFGLNLRYAVIWNWLRRVHI